MGIEFVKVGVLGTVRPLISFPDAGSTRAAYERHVEACEEGNATWPIPFVHAVHDINNWPEDIPFVIVDGARVADRACHPDRCRCEAEGIPVRVHPLARISHQ